MAKTALQQFVEHDGKDITTALEQLRFFCSFAMNGQDWTDVEPFFANVEREMAVSKSPIRTEQKNYCSKCGYHWDRHEMGVPAPYCPSKADIDSNYVVHISDSFGTRRIECETEKEAWDAIGRSTFGSLYSVSSPKGLNVDDFIPF